MNRGDVGLVLGLAGFLLGGAAIFVASDAKRETSGRWEDIQGMVKSDEENLTGMAEKLKAYDAAQKDLARRVNLVDTSPRLAENRLKALEDRVGTLESRGTGAPDPSPGVVGTGAPAPGAADDFDALSKKVMSDQATADEQAKFWAMLREKPEYLADWMKKAEQAVAERPRDKEAHRQLAEVYLAKLMTVPDGIEKGIWSSKMIGEDKAILDIDPNDWDARFSVATNYTFWPEQFNKRPDAIKEFETLRKVQESQTPEAKHAQTYLQLRLLYLKDGRSDDAKAVLEEGLRRFPDDEELKKAK